MIFIHSYENLVEFPKDLANTVLLAREAGLAVEEVNDALLVLNNRPDKLEGLEALFRIIIYKTPDAIKALEKIANSNDKVVFFDAMEVRKNGFIKSLRDVAKAANSNQLLAEVIQDSLAYRTALDLIKLSDIP